jgi:glycerate kinase
MTLNLLIAPSGFKESLSADAVADCIETGILRALTDVHIQKAPLADGGEGFTKALVASTGGMICPITVTGPVGKPVAAFYGVMGGKDPKTVVLEMAAAAGLRLVPSDARDPLRTTTYGVGELIRAALNDGAERILIGCGDSGTNDGGAGMAQALGIRLMDSSYHDIGPGGAELLRIQQIDMTNRDPRLNRVRIDVACNWKNVLCGPRGVARVYGPQKGGSPETIERLEAALEHYAEMISKALGIDVREMAGGGASGGLGSGLYAFLGASLHPWQDIVLQYLEFDSLLQKADLVITAEGTIDGQTLSGKIPAEVSRRAKRYSIPVVALAGSIGKDARINLEHGIDAYASILDAPCSLSEAITNTATLLSNAAEQMIRLLKVGQTLKG